MYYLDTNVLVDCSKGANFHVLNTLKKQSPNNIKIPAIVEAELMFGVYRGVNAEEKIRKLEEIISPYEIIPFDDAAARVYGKLRAEMQSEGNVIGPNDLIIASSVLSRGGILVTSNTKEFNRVKGLRVEDWRK